MVLLDAYLTRVLTSCFIKVHLLKLGNLYADENTIGINEMKQIIYVLIYHALKTLCSTSLKD